MADNGGSNAFLGFVLGALVVVVALIGLGMYGGGYFNGAKTSTIKIEVPKAK
jgi:hypothetical protein